MNTQQNPVVRVTHEHAMCSAVRMSHAHYGCCRRIKERFAVLMTAVMGLVLGTQGVPTITDVKAQQRYPWNGKFDVSYTATGVDEECRDRGLVPSLKVFAVEQATHATNVAEAAYLSGDTPLKNGAHKLVWDMDAQGVFQGLVSTNFEIFVSVEVVKAQGGVQLWKDGPYWAECNVGATKPEEYGYYFWWGDTVGYKRNANNDGWISVKDGAAFSFERKSCSTIYKGNKTLLVEGFIDPMENLAIVCDAAAAYLGATWRMPTDEEAGELIDNCDTSWTMKNGVYGLLVTGRNSYASKSIFLPAAGYGNDSRLLGAAGGDYWSSSLLSDETDDCAWNLCIYPAGAGRYTSDRSSGRSVRPLRKYVATSENVDLVLCSSRSGAIRADLRTGEVRVAEMTEELTYSTEWIGGDTVTIAVKEKSVFQGSGNGIYLWTPLVGGLNELTHTVVTSCVSAVETARFMVVLGIPDLGENPTNEEVSNIVSCAVDKLVALNVDRENYSHFRDWSNCVKTYEGVMVNDKLMMQSENVWFSYALGSDKLLRHAPVQDDITIDGFAPTCQNGRFDFEVSVKNVEIGSSATADNLKKVFGLQGSTDLASSFSSDNVEIEFGTPQNGRVQFTAGPKNTSSETFFMKVRMNGVAEHHPDYGAKDVLSSYLRGTTISRCEGHDGESDAGYRFDGTVSVAGSSPWNVSNTFTIAMWVRPESGQVVPTQSSAGTIMTASQHPYAIFPVHGGSSSVAGFGIAISTNAIVVCEHTGGHLPATLVYTCDLGMNWHHVVITVEDNQGAQLYVDGQFVQQGIASSKIKKLTQASRIGGDAYGHFIGAMDSVLIYEKALSADEVQELYEYLK